MRLPRSPVPPRGRRRLTLGFGVTEAGCEHATSARLPVYTLLIGAFVPQVAIFGVMSSQGLVLLSLYLFDSRLGVGLILPRANRDAETTEGPAQELVGQLLRTPTALPTS